jgi:hypothetical protein
LRTTDSRFTANVLRRNDQLAIIDTTIALGGDPEGRDLSGLAVHAVLLRGGRVYIVGERWALEESSPVVLEVADTGFVSAVSRRE